MGSGRSEDGNKVEGPFCLGIKRSRTVLGGLIRLFVPTCAKSLLCLLIARETHFICRPMHQNPTPSCMKYRYDSVTRAVIVQRDTGMQLQFTLAVGEEPSGRVTDSFSTFKRPRAL